MDEKICQDCLKIVLSNFKNYGYESDFLILSFLQKKEEANLEEISIATKLSTSFRRDAINRLLGAGLINGIRSGNSKLFKLSNSGRSLLRLIETRNY